MQENTETISPFSNGSEAQSWLSSNCEKCARACLWDASTDHRFFEQAIKEGKECDLKYAIDIGFITGEIPIDVYNTIAGDGVFWECSKFRHRENGQGLEGINTPPANPNQLVLFKF